MQFVIHSVSLHVISCIPLKLKLSRSYQAEALNASNGESSSETTTETSTTTAKRTTTTTAITLEEEQPFYQIDTKDLQGCKCKKIRIRCEI